MNVALANLMYEYNARLQHLENLRDKANHPDPTVAHWPGIEAMLLTMYLDDWCEEQGITPRHKDTDE